MSDEDKQIKCTVKIQKIRFYKENWGILVVSPIETEYGTIKTDKYNTMIIKGVMPEPNYQDTYTVVAKEFEDPKWGLQYDIVYMCVYSNMDNPDNQKVFLSKILTPTQMKNLYATLDDPMKVLDEGDIKALTKVKGIGLKTAIAMIERYKEHIDYSVAYVELDKYGLTPNAIKKIVDQYQSPEIAIAKIKNDPYILADDIEGIGWTKADSIALSMGIHPHSPQRVKAFIRYFLEKKAEEGHSFISPTYLMDGILDNIGEEIENEHLGNIIQEMKNELWWDEEKTKIGLKRYYDLELKIATELTRILKGENNFNYDGWREKIAEVEKIQGWEYTEQQIEGIKTVLDNQLVVVTGYGGTGKSSIVSGMLKVLLNYIYSQCALSGRASARLTEVTGTEGVTIHRLLCSNGIQFLFDKENQLIDDIIIVDEISMIGGHLFYSLLQAIKTGAKVILIGDIGQLESIGVLNVASDIINSGIIPVVNLTEIHRQAKKSAIITDSINVRNGIQIIGDTFTGKEIHGELQDLELEIYVNKAHTAKKVIEKFKENLPKVDNIFDLQVILPVKTLGSACTFKINKELQDIYNPYNPSKPEIELSYTKELKYKLRLGDKVLNTKNNYKTLLKINYDEEEIILSEDGEIPYTPIYNGDMGIVTEINDFYLVVDFNRVGEIIIPRKHMKHIELGYACTCHKYQGSESKIIIIGLDFSIPPDMLTREWVYTAITRAKEHCVLCAENKALRYAISNHHVSKKKTHLKHLLQNYHEIVKENNVA